MKKIVKLTVAALAISATAGLAHAAKPGTYAGLGLGYSKTDISFASASSKKTDGLAGRIFGGYNFNQNFGLELGATRYNTLKAKTDNFVYDDVVYNNASLRGHITALDLIAKGYLPFGEGFNAYALAGLAYEMADAKVNASRTVANRTESIRVKGSQDGFAPKFGLGVSYDIPNSNITTGIEASRILKRSSKGLPEMNLVTFNVGYNFN